MNSFKDFIVNYRGAIIGGIIALLVLFTRLYQLIIGIILIKSFINYCVINKYIYICSRLNERILRKT